MIVSLVCKDELHVYEAAQRGKYICLTSLCLLNQSANQYDETSHLEQTKLSSGFEENGLILRDLKKL